MISKSTIQKVFETADVVDVVGAFVKLKKRGVNYIGNCPFHNEKTPSFTVSASKGIYKCFGCSKAGNAVTFVQEHEKLTFPEAITWLAKRYHIEIEETVVSQEVKLAEQTEESIRIINEYAQNYFSRILFETTEGKDIGLSYFKERGFRDDTIHKFKLGYALTVRDDFSTHVLKEGYKKELLLKSGLIAERNGNVVDMYSGRVIFPIHNVSGKTVGFGARILISSEKSPKYINTPENELYQKSKTLYGIYFAKSFITKQDECYLVEGYTDVISLHQAGVENVVASSGTSLTVEQLKLLKRYSKNITILYDGDAAGIKAALRGMDMAIEEGMNVQVVLLPNNHDPDSFIQEVGASAFQEFVTQNRKDIILFKLEVSLKDAQEDSVKKATLLNEIAETISKINKVEEFSKQQDYIKRCSQLLKIDEQGLIALVNKKIREKVIKTEFVSREEATELEKNAAPEVIHTDQNIENLFKKDFLQEKELIRNLLEFGNRPFDDTITIADHIRTNISAEEIVTDAWKKIYILYFKLLDETLQFPELKFFTYHEDEEIRIASIDALHFPYELSDNWEKIHQIITPRRDVLSLSIIQSTVVYFQLRKIKNMFLEINSELENIKDDEEEKVLLTALADLKKNESALFSTTKAALIR